MPTSFTVFSLGNLTDIDTRNGDNDAENAGALVGSVFGGVGNALVNNAAEFSPGNTGFSGGTNTAYDQDNSPNETFQINGGANQVFDSAAVYNATITYIDGTTATVSAVIFQDINGNTYWAPEFSANADQSAMEAAAIRSLELNSLAGDTYSGLNGTRESWDYVTCYVRGTHILTPRGERLIEDLRIGDTVSTRDHGAQTIRWIGQTQAVAQGKLAPIKIAKGSLGVDYPVRDLWVSRQHRMLLRSRIAERMFGSAEVLTPAIKLTLLKGIEVAEAPMPVTYFHLLLDRHEILYAEGALSESLLTGPGALNAMGAEAVEELNTLFPGIAQTRIEPARPIVQNARLAKLFERHAKHGRELVS
ncbi:Hint domain-containing protein [Alphaproteobacteria bacterium KMM 3653]|uniref:Hint domain-containing protein n=1 Tax=Harenicola maris TaxID=2841044 RepID=A0AAP2G3B1_9RHOB|nr:Hint domain-containing protein [Harenicola maris]